MISIRRILALILLTTGLNACGLKGDLYLEEPETPAETAEAAAPGAEVPNEEAPDTEASETEAPETETTDTGTSGTSGPEADSLETPAADEVP